MKTTKPNNAAAQAILLIVGAAFAFFLYVVSTMDDAGDYQPSKAERYARAAEAGRAAGQAAGERIAR